MHLKMGDFIMGMGKTFATEAMEISEKLCLNEGNVIFSVGNAAGHFYVLLKGQVKLSLGNSGPVVYQARHPGEIIGWSCLIGRKTYSASAECMEPTDLLRFDRKNFLKVLTKNPANEALLYKRLAAMLGNRLLELYPTIT
ncbi:MAG: cyclic nucleotide-binding domain-containing protein [Desulfobacterales bacterium]